MGIATRRYPGRGHIYHRDINAGNSFKSERYLNRKISYLGNVLIEISEWRISRWEIYIVVIYLNR